MLNCIRFELQRIYVKCKIPHTFGYEIKHTKTLFAAYLPQILFHFTASPLQIFGVNQWRPQDFDCRRHWRKFKFINASQSLLLCQREFDRVWIDVEVIDIWCNNIRESLHLIEIFGFTHSNRRIMILRFSDETSSFCFISLPNTYSKITSSHIERTLCALWMKQRPLRSLSQSKCI